MRLLLALPAREELYGGEAFVNHSSPAFIFKIQIVPMLEPAGRARHIDVAACPEPVIEVPLRHPVIEVEVAGVLAAHRHAFRLKAAVLQNADVIPVTHTVGGQLTLLEHPVVIKGAHRGALILETAAGEAVVLEGPGRHSVVIKGADRGAIVMEAAGGGAVVKHVLPGRGGS